MRVSVGELSGSKHEHDGLAILSCTELYFVRRLCFFGIDVELEIVLRVGICVQKPLYEKTVAKMYVSWRKEIK